MTCHTSSGELAARKTSCVRTEEAASIQFLVRNGRQETIKGLWGLLTRSSVHNSGRLRALDKIEQVCLFLSCYSFSLHLSIPGLFSPFPSVALQWAGRIDEAFSPDSIYLFQPAPHARVM